MSHLPHISIIILNWNGRSYLETCLQAVAQLDYPSYETLLVDNNSKDDSLAFVRAKFPWVHILKNRRNLGYAAGNNRALRLLKHEFAVLINPDIIVTPFWLKALIKPMLADQTVAVAGCKLYYPGGRLLQHAGGTISGPRAMPDHRGLGQADQGQFETLVDVDYVTGAAIALRRSALETIGLFDEGFFMYFEEVDLCSRALANGWRVIYVPQAVAIHDESAFAVRGSPSYLQRFHSGRWRFLLKHFSGQTIIEQTFAAEEEWLENLDWQERHAVNRAYRTTLAALSGIIQARQNHGGTPFASQEQEQIQTGLLRLRRTAVQNRHNDRALAALEAQGQIEMQPFSSTVPLIGPLIARLRWAWATVAARPNIQSFADQQNQFNHKLIQKLGQLAQELPFPTARWLEQDQNLGTIRRRHQQTAEQLKDMIQRLQSLEMRLQGLKNEGLGGQDSNEV